MEEMLRLAGEDMDLKELARSFRKRPVRVERGEEYYFLLLESEGPREDLEVMADGTKALAQMNALIMARDPQFRPPTFHGITKKNTDGSLSHYLSPGKINAQARSAGVVTVRLLGPDGKIVEIVESKVPTEDQIALQLAANNEPLRRALLIYGSLEHNWINLYKVLEAMEDGNGGEAGLIAKNFVAPGEIKDFKAAVNSFRALGMDARHGTTTTGIPAPKMTLMEAEEMFRKLFQGWLRELKDRGNP